METYAVAGKSGAELYASIGERGPEVGRGRTIAYTNFKLTCRGNTSGRATPAFWRRRAEARHHLQAAEACWNSGLYRSGNWKTFIAGVNTHEKVHGDIIKDMVREIEAASVGLTVPGDPDCRKIRTEMTKRLSELSLAQRQQSRDFDQVEISDGGNIHRLILGLVNGG